MASIPIRRGLVGARLVVALTAVGVVATVTRPLPAQSDVAETKPVRALLITGGCCHDYDYQARKLVQGSQERALVEWTVELDPRNGTRGKIELYDDPDWAKPYDVVVHNECFADTRDPEYVRKITEVHKGGVPAVVIHCAMHTYRAADFDDWRELLGVTSMHHEHQSEYIVKNEAFDHPIMEGFPTEWITPRDELYIIRKVWPNTTALATAESERDSGAQPVIWTSKFGEARVFGTTFGHNSATFNDPVFLNFVTRGILWAADRLSDDYLQPMEVATEPADAEPAHPEPEPDVAEPADEDNLSTNDTTPEPSLLDEVKVPEGFTATIYATPPEVNYPVFVAAAPNGDLYVSVDKNGSLDREPNRGSVLRLRDTTGDGQADEIKTFIENVDSPRGLAWDHDRLYLMHPPHLSVFVDEDGDGTSDRQEIIVKNIAFGLNERPADHTSNGVTLGIDGWLYLAIGDFGFMNAAGTDGRTLQLRGGGVVRVMTDGTGLELYSRGTRNIVEVAVDPLLNAFARDNTNDGNGWDIRLHHFSGLENHGYPSQFQNFAEEIVQPLAEYGGGSGCGALYLDEPGYPDGFGTALYTADWGRQAVFRQPLQPSGATFTADQDVFAELTRVTDLDADALSRLYLASWKNATYTYNGEDIGFLVRVTPTGYEPTPLPDFANAAEAELVELLKSPSHRRRLEAQRELVRRGIDDDTAATIEQLAADENAELPHRVAALFALKQGLGQQSHAMIAKLAAAADLRPLAIRALADRHDQLADVPTDLILAGLTDANARTRLESAVALARLGDTKHAAQLTRLLDDDDPVVRHTAVQALIRLHAVDACFAVVEAAKASDRMRAGALQVLRSFHEVEVVDCLLDQLAAEDELSRRRGLITALCRLHFRPSNWNGENWGTRPDTRGPYYAMETWPASERIATTMTDALNVAGREETEILLAELNRHRIFLEAVTRQMIARAKENAELVPATIRTLAEVETVPREAVPLLIDALTTSDENEDNEEESGDRRDQNDVRSAAMFALLSTGDPDGFRTVLQAAADDSARQRRGRFGFGRGGGGPLAAALLKPKLLEPHLNLLLSETEHSEDGNIWADAGLLVLSGSNDVDQQVCTTATAALDAAWKSPDRREQLLQAVLMSNHRSWEEQVRAARDDEDRRVARVASRIARRWRLKPWPEPVGPPIKTLNVEEAITAAVAEKGDADYGQSLFTRLQCANCHTTSPGEPLRGPFLPEVVKTYKRRQLAEAILLPDKSIAQGFVTQTFILVDGRVLTGFVTGQESDKVVIRDNEGKELTLPRDEIEEQVEASGSSMPGGLADELAINELAALLDFLQSLAP